MHNAETRMTTTIKGVEVRIYSQDTGPHGKIHGAYHDGAGNWHMASWQSTGFFHPYDQKQGQHCCDMDLITTKKD